MIGETIEKITYRYDASLAAVASTVKRAAVSEHGMRASLRAQSGNVIHYYVITIGGVHDRWTLLGRNDAALGICRGRID